MKDPVKSLIGAAEFEIQVDEGSFADIPKLHSLAIRLNDALVDRDRALRRLESVKSDIRELETVTTEKRMSAVSLSDDYAVMTAGDLRFYFGYEFTMGPADEWCFVVHREKQELMRVPVSKLGAKVGKDPVEYLLEGIALWIGGSA